MGKPGNTAGRKHLSGVGVEQAIADGRLEAENVVEEIEDEEELVPWYARFILSGRPSVADREALVELVHEHGISKAQAQVALVALDALVQNDMTRDLDAFERKRLGYELRLKILGKVLAAAPDDGAKVPIVQLTMEWGGPADAERDRGVCPPTEPPEGWDEDA